ncbi:glutamine amidotransferase [Clostridium beijerinckii]|uniref:Glutamine amidotransferase n=1 Tax=Clostridium beijerinckii TaxID=1520 RepID=A0A1S9N5R5_CLOBE|nr:glutamine amidotransferase [Clostridium beijerinckii]OOP72775.1 glutamine amidotransferase [Clostridium beijerinckii]
MCGIAGIISKHPIDIASKLISMVSLIQHRGPDASGIAVFPKEKNVLVRVSYTNDEKLSLLREIIKNYGEVIKEKYIDAKNSIPFAEYEIDIPKELVSKLHKEINSIDGLAVHSIGKDIKVYKEGGLVKNLISKHSIPEEECRHGIAHVRMATESAEDINAAHPFVSPLYPELAIVHNGQFTNYFNLRRFLESKGAKFKTMNDSEAASHLIAYAMKENGGDLEAALKYAAQEMDGIFCIIAATPNQIGFVKDKLGIKPLLLVESEDLIMFGSEQIEFTALLDDVFAEEMDPGEVRVWNV